MSKIHRRPEELVQIYRYSQQGLTNTQIAEQLNLSYGSVATALNHLSTHLSGKAKGQLRRSRSYVEAAKLIRKEKRQDTGEPNVAFLKASVARFEEDIASYIEQQIKSRFKALHEENAALRAENTQLKEKLESARTINWVDTLEDRLPKGENL